MDLDALRPAGGGDAIRLSSASKSNVSGVILLSDMALRCAAALTRSGESPRPEGFLRLKFN